MHFPWIFYTSLNVLFEKPILVVFIIALITICLNNKNTNLSSSLNYGFWFLYPRRLSIFSSLSLSLYFSLSLSLSLSLLILNRHFRTLSLLSSTLFLFFKFFIIIIFFPLLLPLPQATSNFPTIINHHFLRPSLPVLALPWYLDIIYHIYKSWLTYHSSSSYPMM